MAGPISRLDDAADRLFDNLRGHRRADFVFYLASEAADFSLLWHAISAAMAVVSPRRRRHSARLAVALGIESIVVNGVIKQIMKRERPPERDDPPFEVRRPKTKSFPSGHASSATLAAGLLSDAAPRLRPAWASLAAIVAVSRVHNRMHHATDVAAGVVLGAFFSWTTKRWRPLPPVSGSGRS